MDETFKQELKRFFQKEWEYQIGSAEDFIITFEEWLEEQKFDLSTVIQYK
jgi:hypothetical protein